MKFLKYLFFFILGLLLFVFLLGIVKPTVNYGHEVTVNKPIKEAWAVQQDPSKLDQWIKGFKSIDHISGDMGEVGSKYKVIVNPGEGQDDFEMIETIVSKKEFDHIELVFDSDMMQFNQRATFSENNGKTTVKTDSKVTGNGMIMRSMFAVMDLFSGNFQKQEVENINALKKVIEENTTDYYPKPLETEAEEAAM